MYLRLLGVVESGVETEVGAKGVGDAVVVGVVENAVQGWGTRGI